MFTQVGVKQLTDFLRTVTAASDLVDCTLVNCETVDVKYLKILKTQRFQNSTSIMCSTCLILVTVSVISWRKPSDSSQKSLSCKTDVFIGKVVQKPIGQKNNFVPPPPLKRFDGCMLTMIQWANFLAWVPSLDVDSSY